MMANNLGTAAFRFWQKEIERYNPKIIFQGLTLDFQWCIVFCCSSKRVKIMINRRSKILDGRYYWTNDRYEQNNKSLAAAAKKIDKKQDPTNSSQQFYASFKKILSPFSIFEKIGLTAAPLRSGD